MSVDQLVEEIRKLSESDRELLFSKLDKTNGAAVIEETPEFIAFVEEGLRSAEQEPMIPIEDVIEEMKSWTTKSS